MASRSRARGLTIGVVGATGMVGREILHVLEKRRFPVGHISCFSSGSGRKQVRFRGRSLPAPGIDRNALTACDLIFFVSSDAVSKRHAPGLAARGVWVIDDSSAFRLDPKVPLIIPEVNAAALKPSTRLIAGPNCTMAPVAVAGAAWHRFARIKEVRVASYQAVSGAGRAALDEFILQDRRQARGLKSGGRARILPQAPHAALPRPIAFNVIPQVGGFDRDGHSGEELKFADELRKVWSAPGLAVSLTAVRVPVIRGHALSAWFRTKKPISISKARALLKKAPGLHLSGRGTYPTPLSAGGRYPVFAGRLRPGAVPGELALWIVSDNLLKGAALNSVQIAEQLLKNRWLGP